MKLLYPNKLLCVFDQALVLFVGFVIVFGSEGALGRFDVALGRLGVG